MARSIEELRQWFDDFVAVTSTARNDAYKCRDYKDGKQWTAEQQKTLEERGQAAIVNNRIAPKVDTLVGLEITGRTDPKAFPRNPGDEDAAEAATDALRFIEDDTDFDEEATYAFDELIVEGIEAGEVTVDENGDVHMRHLPFDRIWYDPLSRKRDFSDRRYGGLITWMDADQAEARWPKAKEAISATIYQGQSEMDTEFSEKSIAAWVDPKRKRVAVLECYYQDGAGEVMRCLFCWGGFLEESKPSPYKDEDGRAADPYEFAHAFIDRDRRRYGPVKHWIPLQDEINHRHSKALFLLSVRQTFGNGSAISDVEEAKNQLSRPDGHLEVEHGTFGQDFGILPTGDMAQGQFLLLQEAKSAIDTVGVNRELSGDARASQSGRAIQALQSAGSLELQPVLNAHRAWRRRMYRKAWLCAKQFWTGPKWVRVTDDENKAKFVQLNAPETVGDLIEAKVKAGEISQEQLRAMMESGELTPEKAAQPTGRKRNDVSTLDVDIIVDASPDTASIQQEQFQILAELASGGLPIPPKALIAASQLRNKDQILQAMEQPEPSPAAQQAQQLALAEKQADIEKTMAGASRDKAAAIKDITEASRAQAGVEAIG